MSIPPQQDGKVERRTGGERRSGVERRSTPFERRRHALYCWLFRLKPHFAEVNPNAPRPKPAAWLTDERRIDVLLALHGTTWESIHQWENRIFQAFLLSIGGMLSAITFLFDHPNLHKYTPLLGSAITIFGIATLAYLYLAAKAHANNGTLLVKIEAALGMCEPGKYIKGKPFFGYSGYWVEDWRTPILLMIHLAVVLFSAYAVFDQLA